jgi:DNA primase
MAYLERNPAIGHISLCLDNDDSGRAAAQRITNVLGADGRYRDIAVTFDWPEVAKDYNEALLQAIALEREHSKSSPHRGAVFSL